ncbi:hypothetical protein D9M73_260880 [compost metagenome]
MQEHFEAFVGQLLRLLLAVADFFQGMEQHPPAQGADAVLEAGLGLHQALADGEQVLHRHAAQDWGVGFEPVAQHDFRAGDHRRGVPQGVVEVEGSQLDAHESVPLLRLARGWALSYTAARCWKSRWV